MLRAPYTAWTDSEAKELGRLAADGRTARQIAAALGFSLAAVRGRIWRQGVRLQPAWSPSMGHRLRQLVKEGASRREAAEELGVTIRQAVYQAGKMGLAFYSQVAPDPVRLSRILSLVSLGHDTGASLAAPLGVCPSVANRAARRLVAAGLLRRVGVRRWSKLRVGRAWNEPDERQTKEPGGVPC